MKRHDLCACQQDINHDNRVSSNINNSSRSGGSEPRWDGPSQTPGRKRKMDEVAGIPIHCLLGKKMLTFKTSLEPS